MPLTTLLKDALRSGALASLLSTAVLAARGRREAGTPYGPTNATSHWLWGERAFARDGFSLRYTVAGYLIHHASATFWALLGHHWLRGKKPLPALGNAVVVSAVACAVDYGLTPPRLRPGYEQRLGRASLALVYLGFAAGLALGALLQPSRPRG
jgi:hypothetical protein